MPSLELLETTAATTLEEFVTDVTSASTDLQPDCWDNRPTWDNWSKK